MYSSPQIRRYQYFICTDWPGGLVPSPTLAGSRTGALMAGCWATMLYFGEYGYIESTRIIVETARLFISAVKKIPGLFVLGQPQASVVAFGSRDFDILRLADPLSRRGWGLSVVQFPPAIHISFTFLSAKSVNLLVAELAELAEEMLKDPSKKAEGQGAIYGTAQSVPDRTLITEIAKGFISICYDIPN